MKQKINRGLRTDGQKGAVSPDSCHELVFIQDVLKGGEAINPRVTYSTSQIDLNLLIKLRFDKSVLASWNATRISNILEAVYDILVLQWIPD